MSNYQYFVAHVADAKKPHLYRTKEIAGKMICTQMDTADEDNATVTVRRSEVMVHLGEKPRYGSVYGVLVEPLLFHRIIKRWGKIHFYTELPEEQTERMIKSFQRVNDKLTEMGLVAWQPCRTEIRNPKGKSAGHYYYRSAGEDTLIIRPQEIQSSRELRMTIAHEAAHGIWFRNMTSKQRAGWNRLYQDYLAVRQVSTSSIKRITQELAQQGSVRAYVKSLTEIHEKAELDIYLQWLTKVHNVSKHTIDDMIQAQEKLPRPDVHLFRSEVDTPVTNYGTKNAEEMFAEAFGLYIIEDLSNERILQKIQKLAAK